jgi:hypothetical protein
MRKRIKWGNIYITFIVIATIITATVERIQNKPTESEQSFSEYKTTQTEQTVACEEENNEIEEVITWTSYRLTSYWTGDNTGSGEYVGAGIHTSKFDVNSKGWYTYKDKLVLAGATNECLRDKKSACKQWNIPKENKHYFNYYDELTVLIDGIEYEAIILDSCGASMRLDENRLDLFVSNKNSMIDRGYRGVNSIQVKEVD